MANKLDRQHGNKFINQQLIDKLQQAIRTTFGQTSRDTETENEEENINSSQLGIRIANKRQHKSKERFSKQSNS